MLGKNLLIASFIYLFIYFANVINNMISCSHNLYPNNKHNRSKKQQQQQITIKTGHKCALKIIHCAKYR